MEKMNYFIGVDVSKDTLDIAVLKAGNLVLERKIDNQKKAIRAFLREASKTLGLELNQTLVCMEDTGIYNNIMLKILFDIKVSICVESALQIKKSQGIARGKNDKVDARRIAVYAYKNFSELKLWQPQRASVQKLQALITLRERLVKVKMQLKTPLQESIAFMDSSTIKSMKSATRESLRSLDRDLNRIEKEIHLLVIKDELLKRQFDIATSVTGIGKVTALNMIVTSGEFQRISNPKSFACHSGVAPFEHTSGTSVKGRTRVSKLANMGMKKILHLAALSAIQFNEELRNYYNRKVSEGKNKMAVINAVRNKLITRVFVCIKQDRMYKKNYQHELA